jgi:amino acid adenylation domain-containing protein
MSESSARAPDLSPQEKRTLLSQLLRHKTRPAVSELALSYGQQALWLTQQLAPESWAYNVLFAARIRSEVETMALQRAFQALLERHPILRTTYVMRHGRPERQIHTHLPVSFEVIDATACSEQALQNRLIEAARQPFDLEYGPLLRVRLFTRAATDHVLLLAIHHIAVDIFALGLLLEELRVLYPAAKAGIEAILPPLGRQYTDFVRWQAELLAGPEGERLWAYWQQQLTGELPELQLPTDWPRPPMPTNDGASHTFALGAKLTQQLKALMRAEGTTLYMTLLAAFYVLLHRYTGQEDLLVGTFTADRVRPEFRRIVGYFVNPVVVRATLRGNSSFRAFLGQVRQTVLEALKHQDFPFPLLVERLQPARHASRAPLFQVVFVLQQLYHQEEILQCFLPGITDVQIDFGGLVLEPFALPQQEGQFDLTLEMTQVEEALWGSLKYNTDLFDAPTIARMAGHFQMLLEGIVANPDTPLWALPLLPDAERQQLLVEWNKTVTASPPTGSCVHQMFEAQVERTPDAVAVVFEDGQLTYRELHQRANQLAHHLRSLGVGPEVLVGLCVEPSLDMLVGLLGILKAGAAYVPLDPAYPKERLAFMLEDSQATVLVTQQRLLAGFPQHRAQVVCLDMDRETVAAKDRGNPVSGVTGGNLAYVIYTSGSTGKPKGVLIPHRAVVNFLQAMRQQPGLTSEDILLAVTTLSFDIAVLELLLPLTVGARVVVASRAVVLDGVGLAAQLAETAATVVQATPTTWRLLLAAGWQGSPQVNSLCGGEALSRELADRLLERCASLWNLYGPTETTIWSAVHHVEAGTGPIPIGRPVAMTQFYVLDAHLHPVPIGIPGELYIGGLGLARGYLHRPALTAEKFIRHPCSDEPGARLYKTGDVVRYLPDGTLEFLGRIDHQVKVRGFRIELGEIEILLEQHPAVRQAVVTVREDMAGEQRLVAYIVAEPGLAPAVSSLRAFLKHKLPDYMVPSTFVFLAAFPLTPNAKVDRRALPAPQEGRPVLDTAFVTPMSEMEHQIVAIWQDVLRIDNVGTHDNFFDLGGHSLLAVQVHMKLQTLLARDFPLVELFKHPTVSALVQYFTQSPIIPSSPPPRHGRTQARRALVSQQRELRQSHRAHRGAQGN